MKLLALCRTITWFLWGPLLLLSHTVIQLFFIQRLRAAYIHTYFTTVNNIHVHSENLYYVHCSKA
jgi:hypothetical protein